MIKLTEQAGIDHDPVRVSRRRARRQHVRPGRSRLLVVVAATIVLAVPMQANVAADAAAPSGCSSPVLSSGFHQHLVDASIAPLGDIPADVRTVPLWSSSFTTAGQSYPYTMVGTDPAAGSTTTRVPVVIVPLRLDFASDHCSLQDPTMASDITSSPLFTPTPFATGTTQYLDAIQRGNFWSAVSTNSPDYHLLLGTPQVEPVQTLQVPAAQGLTVLNQFTNRREGVVGSKWLYVRLLSLLNSLHIDPGTLPLFVSYNTYVTDQNPTDCLSPGGCGFFTGYHDAVFSSHDPHAINTYAFSSFIDYGDAIPPQFDIHVSVLSHEILEWANDPFVHGARLAGQVTDFANLVPPWTSPYYGASTLCNPALEVADPLEAGPFIGAVPPGSPSLYLLANAAFLSWFARESPSTAVGGLYDAGGVFTSYSDDCAHSTAQQQTSGAGLHFGADVLVRTYTRQE